MTFGKMEPNAFQGVFKFHTWCVNPQECDLELLCFRGQAVLLQPIIIVYPMFEVLVWVNL